MRDKVFFIRLMITNRPYTSLFIEGGLDPLQTNFRAFPAILANNRSTKLGTLICSAHARTVRTADRPAAGPDRPLAQSGAQHIPLPFDGAERTKSILTRCDYIGFLKHLATY
jgi:hypothetical protein